jgi:hypothetical protein
MPPDVAASLELHRFILCVALAFVGALAICLGYILFSRGAGLLKAIDRLAIKKSEFNVSITGMSAGAVLMLTSVVWGYWSYSAAPRLELAGNLLRITSVSNNSSVASSVDLPYAKLTGSDVFGADKQKIGTITGVLVGKDSMAKAFTVDVEVPQNGQKQVLIDAKDFALIPNGADRPSVFLGGIGRGDAIQSATTIQPDTLN